MAQISVTRHFLMNARPTVSICLGLVRVWRLTCWGRTKGQTWAWVSAKKRPDLDGWVWFLTDPHQTWGWPRGSCQSDYKSGFCTDFEFRSKTWVSRPSDLQQTQSNLVRFLLTSIKPQSVSNCASRPGLQFYDSLLTSSKPPHSLCLAMRSENF